MFFVNFLITVNDLCKKFLIVVNEKFHLEGTIVYTTFQIQTMQTHCSLVRSKEVLVFNNGCARKLLF